MDLGTIGSGSRFARAQRDEQVEHRESTRGYPNGIPPPLGGN
jgi:hypothetical protein